MAENIAEKENLEGLKAITLSLPPPRRLIHRLSTIYWRNWQAILERLKNRRKRRKQPAEAFVKRRIRLRGVNGDIEGKIWESDSLLRAGRLESLEIVLDDTSVSRRHAEI